MSRIVIGKHGRENVHLDLDVLLKTRLLLQANSGGGKSWLIRRLAEGLFGKVQVLIIDLEGEFATLRERFGYVLVGKGGETPADPRSAALVARRLLELNASAVCDLYEMKAHERHRWVRLFLEALIDAPKNLWHPAVVIVDEAHVVCPEKGAGESEASDAVIGLATRGRKRGFACVLASQRLGKLRKDVAAELLNVMIGQTFIDIDLKRAAEALGIPRSDERPFFAQMKVVEPGNFWALGRAISKERILMKVGPVETTHPEPGSSKYAAAPPPAPERIKALLPKLADLPKEAEEKAKTETELRHEIRSLKAQLAARPKETVEVAKERRIEVPVVKDIQLRRLETALGRAEKAVEPGTHGLTERLEKGLALARQTVSDFADAAKDIRIAIAESRREPAPARPVPAQPGIRPMPIPARIHETHPDPEANGEEPLIAGERRMLEVLAQFHPGTRTRSQLGALAGYTPSGGTFGNYFGRLRRFGLVLERHDGAVEITDKGLAYFGTTPPRGPDGPQELLEMWRKKLLAGERKMLDVLVGIYPKPITRGELGERTGYAASGGTFGNYLGTLRRNALATVEGESVRAADTLFEMEKI
jgi:hypothetical protein